MHAVTARSAAIATMLAIASLIAASCTDDPSAKYFPSRAPAANQSAPIDSGTTVDLTAGLLAARLLHGAVARPDPKLTPGAVAITDLTTVCHSNKRIPGQFMALNPMISVSNRQAAFAEYNIASGNERHYGLDFLIPLQLGGANVRANIWPASASHGVGFHEKQVLNIRIHELVCEGAMPLAQAQKGIATDWVRLWLQFG
jgi:hypothetical protein